MERSVLQVYGAVIGDRPAGIVRHFPDVAVRVGKGPSETTPVGYGGSADYRTPGALCFQQYFVDLLGCPNVVSELYPRSTVASQGGPQTENRSTRLKEADFFVWLLSTTPAECLVERARTAEVRHPERNETDPLFHDVISTTDRAVPADYGVDRGPDSVQRSRRGSADLRSRWGSWRALRTAHSDVPVHVTAPVAVRSRQYQAVLASTRPQERCRAVAASTVPADCPASRVEARNRLSSRKV